MIRFCTIRDVKKPERELGNAGIDIFIPNYSDSFKDELNEKNDIGLAWADEDKLYLQPFGRILIPAGLKSSFDINVALEAANKSGIATKTGLIVGAQVIDASYQGEIHISLINTTGSVVELDYGQKVVQLIPRRINVEEIEVTDNPKGFYATVTKRGSGGFGSTGI